MFKKEEILPLNLWNHHCWCQRPGKFAWDSPRGCRWTSHRELSWIPWSQYDRPEKNENLSGSLMILSFRSTVNVPFCKNCIVIPIFALARISSSSLSRTAALSSSTVSVNININPNNYYSSYWRTTNSLCNMYDVIH